MGIEKASAYQAMVGFSHDFYNRSMTALPESHSDTSGVNESYSYSVESDEDDDGKKIQSSSTLETAASTWISQSSSEGDDYNASTEEDVDDMAEREDELSEDQSVGKSCHLYNVYSVEHIYPCLTFVTFTHLRKMSSSN